MSSQAGMAADGGWTSTVRAPPSSITLRRRAFTLKASLAPFDQPSPHPAPAARSHVQRFNAEISGLCSSSDTLAGGSMMRTNQVGAEQVRPLFLRSEQGC